MIGQHLRVCYFGTYRANYARNQMMIAGLRRDGVQVIECHEQLWHGIEDRVQVTRGGWLRPSFWWRVLRTCTRLLWSYRKVPDYDVMVVGYPGQFDVFLARLLTWLRRKPLVWDVFMSIYLIALERGLEQHSALTVGAVRRMEWLACRLPDMLIIDTAEYSRWFHYTHGVTLDRFRLVPTGADDRIFKPAIGRDTQDGFFRIVYYGTFIPNHGVEYIVEAARLLADDPAIRFELIGTGPDEVKALMLVQRYSLSNVIFTDWLDQAGLVKRVARADVCLGAFGTTQQSVMTVQNKIYEGLAMAKPVISGDSPALRQAFTHGEHIYLCKRDDPQSLAEAIRTLKCDSTLRQQLAQGGHRLFCEQYDLAHKGQCFRRHLEEVVAGRSRKPKPELPEHSKSR